MTLSGEFNSLTGGPKEIKNNKLWIRKYIGIKELGDITFSIKLPRFFSILKIFSLRKKFNFSKSKCVDFSLIKNFKCFRFKALVVKKQIYLDYNATVPLLKEVKESLIDCMNVGPLNASSIHYYGRKGKDIIDIARTNISKFINTNNNRKFCRTLCSVIFIQK